MGATVPDGRRGSRAEPGAARDKRHHYAPRFIGREGANILQARPAYHTPSPDMPTLAPEASALLRLRCSISAVENAAGEAV